MTEQIQNEEQTEVEVYQAPNKGLMLATELPDLDKMAVSEQAISMQYLAFDKDVKVRANYAGMTKIKSKKNLQPGEDFRELDAVVLQTKTGLFLNSGASLVEQLRAIPAGTPIQVTFIGTEKTSSGNNVNKFDVRLLSLWAPSHETISKWNDLVTKARQAGVDMNFEIGASNSAGDLADRVTAIKSAIELKLKQSKAKK